MGFLLRSFITEISKFILECVFQVLSFILGLFDTQFGYDTKMFHDIFDPAGVILPTVLDVFKWVGFGLVLVFFVWNLWRAYFGPAMDSKINPVPLIGRFLIATFAVFAIYQILTTVVINMFVIPHSIIQGLSVPTTSEMSDWWANANSSEGFFVDIWNAIVEAVSWSGFVEKILSMGLFGTCTIIFMMKMVKLITEMVERYLLMNILVYSSPLAAATLASPSMSSVFSGWCKMLGGQMILILYNVLSIKLIMAGYSSVGGKIASSGNNLGDASGTLLFGFVLLFAMLNIAQRFDTYLNQIGINAGITGNSLIQGDTGAVKSIFNAFKGAVTQASKEGSSIGVDSRGSSPSNPAKINKGSSDNTSTAKDKNGGSNDSSGGQKINGGGSQSIFGASKQMSKAERTESQKERANEWLSKQNGSGASDIANNADISGCYEYTDADVPPYCDNSDTEPSSINNCGHENNSASIYADGSESQMTVSSADTVQSVNSVGGSYYSDSTNTTEISNTSSSGSPHSSYDSGNGKSHNSAQINGSMANTLGADLSNSNAGNSTLSSGNSKNDSYTSNHGSNTINNSPNLTNDKPMNNPYLNKDKINSTSAKVFQKKDGK